MSYDQCGARWGECPWAREIEGSTAHFCAEMVSHQGQCRCACGKKLTGKPDATVLKPARPDHLL